RLRGRAQGAGPAAAGAGEARGAARASRGRAVKQDETPQSLRKRPQPGRVRAIVLAVAVHAAFIALIVFGVRWQSMPTPPVLAELWDKLPAQQKPAPPPPQPEPAKPEPVKPPPPKPPEPT